MGGAEERGEGECLPTPPPPWKSTGRGVGPYLLLWQQIGHSFSVEGA